MQRDRPHVTASESDLTSPGAPPLAKVTEDVARTAVERAMKVAEVLQAGHQGALAADPGTLQFGFR